MAEDPEAVRRVSLVENLIQLLKQVNVKNVDEYQGLPLDSKRAHGSAGRHHVGEKSAAAPSTSPSPLSSSPWSLHAGHNFPCSDTHKALPRPPSQWPQAPLMIRPTPHTSTKILGIRRASSGEYESIGGFCAGCLLPLNTGQEARGDSLVIDFESTHFVGTLLMRLKQAKRLNQQHQHRQAIIDTDDDAQKVKSSTEMTMTTTKMKKKKYPSYFDGKKRKFQAVVRGQFKTPLPMNETVTGQSFDRPAGKLPARWIVTSFIKFVSALAPQLEARLDGKSPCFLTPLVATAQTVLQRPAIPKTTNVALISYTDLEDELEELPSTHPASLLPAAQQALGSTTLDDTKSLSVAARMKARKRAFNQLAAATAVANSKQRKGDSSLPSSSLRFDTLKDYTFEFYQHLLDFGDEGMAVDMGRPIGKVGLAQVTDGQPLKFMSAHKDPTTGILDSLWSFDIWHASLYPYAERACIAAGES